MKQNPPWLLAICCLIGASCGPKAQQDIEKTAEDMKESGKKLAVATEKLVQTLEQESGEVGAAWQQFQEAAGLGSNAVVVSYRSLKTALPTGIDGFEAGSATGGHEKIFGIGTSRARVTLTAENGATVSVTIVDTGSMKALAGIAEKVLALSELERESDTGYERLFTFQGHRGYERYDQESRTGSKRLFVGNVFDVQLDGSNIDEEDLDRVLAAIDLEKLGSLKLEAIRAARGQGDT